MKKLLFIIAGVALFSCGKKPETTQPKIQEITSSIYASGTVKSENQHQVFPLVSGLIQEILVDDGDKVKAGQVLIRVDNRTQQLTKENAALLASFNDVEANQDALDNAKEAMLFSRDKLKNDSVMYEKAKSLYQSGVISGTEFDQRELNYESSRNNYRTASTRYKDLKRQLSLNSMQSKNNLAISSKTEQDFLIRSDLDGEVYSILKDKGELISPQTPVAIIGSANSFVLEMQVDEYDISKVNVGQQVFITMDSYKGRVFEAKVSKVNPIMNERSKTFLVEAVFVKAPPRVYPNTSFEASIVMETKSKALVIPKRFLVSENEVMLEDGSLRKVVIGLKDFEYVEILKGLKSSDKIVVKE